VYKVACGEQVEHCDGRRHTSSNSCSSAAANCSHNSMKARRDTGTGLAFPCCRAEGCVSCDLCWLLEFCGFCQARDFCHFCWFCGPSRPDRPS